MSSAGPGEPLPPSLPGVDARRAGTPRPGTLPAVDDLLEDAVRAARIPGIVALAADEHGPLYEGAFGWSDVATRAPMTRDTVFWIASMTKAVTSIAAMQLVEEGRLALDAPLGRLVPGLASPRVLEGFDGSGAPQLRPARRPITLRHLLTHTAGFAYDFWNADVARYRLQAGVPALLSGADAALHVPLVDDPGERWEYGISTDWVGKAVEAASGLRLDLYFRERILGPLGMDETVFAPSPAQRARLASLHERRGDGSLAPIPFALPPAPEFWMGGGGLYSTGPDYLRLLRMLLGGGTLGGVRILSPDSVEEMARNQIGPLEVPMLRTAIPQISNDADLLPGVRKKWGLGFLINDEDAPTGRRAGSLAWAGFANGYYWADRRRGVAGVVLMQILPFADPDALGVFAAFERGVYDALGDATPPS